MASLIQSLAMSGSRKADGAVNAGGRVFLYSPGTSAGIDAYTDRNKSSVITLDNGGILLDATGRRQIWIDAPCDVTEEDADGGFIASYPAGSDITANVVELISPGFTGMGDDGIMQANRRTYLSSAMASLFASCGGLDGKFRGDYGSVDLNVNDAIQGFGLTPQMFGALGDGATNDTTALVELFSAVDALVAAGKNAAVIFPAGTYLTSQVLLTQASVISGSGAEKTIIKGTNSTMICLQSTATSLTMSNISIAHSSSSTSDGISIASGSAVLINVNSTGYTNALRARTLGLTPAPVMTIGGNLTGSTAAILGSAAIWGTITTGTLSASTKTVQVA